MLTVFFFAACTLLLLTYLLTDVNWQVLEPANTLSSGLLVTTGGATVDRHQTLAEADAARSSRLGIVVLGVGSVVNGSEAAAIATRADDGVVYADSFDHLFDTNANFADLLTEKICGTCALAVVKKHLDYSCPFSISK